MLLHNGMRTTYNCLIAVLLLIARRKNVLSQSAYLFTLSVTNQIAQKTIENEEKLTSHFGQKQRPNHRAFSVEKNSSHKKRCGKWYFAFPGKLLHFQVVDIFF